MRILFFIRSARRTGAEIALRNFISYAAAEGVEMAVACQEGGEMLAELPPAVAVFVFKQQLFDGMRMRLGGYLPGPTRPPSDRFILGAHKKFRPDVWYVNTVLQPSVVRLAKEHSVPCVVHAHELEPLLFGVSEQGLKEAVSYSKLIFAGSQAVRKMFSTLGREHGVEVSYAAIDPAQIKPDPEKSKAIRRALGIRDETFVWAMSGTLDPNKNPVRFVEVAGELSKGDREVRFIWLGGSESGYSLYAKELARELGLAERMNWLGARAEDYYDLLNAADGLALTSSRESFSIVSVEAAFLGKPVVAFDCGGVREILVEGMGALVSSWNSSDFAREMSKVMSGETVFDPRVSQERVKEFFINVQGARWMLALRKHFAS